MERRLAAILAADVVGYSRLMGADEAGTLERLTRLRKERIEPLIATHRGRVFKLMGDGILVEFAQRISSILTERIWQDVARNIGRKQLRDNDAHDHAYRGIELLHRLEPGSMARAQDHFQAGLALHPDLPYGHLGLGFCYLTSGFWGDPDGALLEQAHHHALFHGETGEALEWIDKVLDLHRTPPTRLTSCATGRPLPSSSPATMPPPPPCSAPSPA